jgi:hypothetical protein
MSLVEVLVAVTILGLGVSAIVGGLGAAARGSDLHRKTVDADTVVRGWAESIKERARKGGYQDCSPGESASPDYSPAAVGYGVPSGYTVGYGSGGAAYQSSSNLNMVLVFDKSGSIAPAATAATNAAKGFLAALSNTGAVVSLVSFADRAAIDAEPSPVTTATLAGLQAKVPTAFTGGTNWDEGLSAALGQVGKFTVGPAPLIVMITDGDPTYYTDASGNLGGNGSTVTQTNVDEAVYQAGLLENAAHSKIFVIGVTGLSGINIDNLKAISGPKQYPANTFTTADWMTVNDFSTLSGALQGIATDLTSDSFAGACPASGDQGAQRLSLTATSGDGRASETIEVVVRRS